ncbi:MAG: hypothetical protein J7527_15565 [Chitinophagaceae bacterium]|nr:hypothetical protein [Chitinophagaceae bacterium]
MQFDTPSTDADEMKTLSSCMNKLIADGYTEQFKVGDEGLESPDSGKAYQPGEVHVRNFYRFEGASDPDDNSILYAIETDGGEKGLLTDAYGTYADPRVGKFMQEVEDISKKTVKS